MFIFSVGKGLQHSVWTIFGASAIILCHKAMMSLLQVVQTCCCDQLMEPCNRSGPKGIFFSLPAISQRLGIARTLLYFCRFKPMSGPINCNGAVLGFSVKQVLMCFVVSG